MAPWAGKQQSSSNTILRQLLALVHQSKQLLFEHAGKQSGKDSQAHIGYIQSGKMIVGTSKAMCTAC